MPADVIGPDGPPVDASIDGVPTATLTVVRSGTSTGTVASNSAGGAMIDCGTTCMAAFPIGTLVTLTATPDTGATFAGWGGACSGTTPTCSFTLTEDSSVTASFDVAQHRVTITPTGNGVGSVTANVGGIVCPGTCEAVVPYGTQITLTPAAVAPSLFAGWNDVGCTGTVPCTFTVTQDEVIDAPFVLNYTVTVSKNGNGHGRVTSSPAGIDCGVDCDQVYSAGAMVSLTATADPDSNFVGWGGACGGMGACMVTVNAVVAVTANFELKRYTLTATRSGAGGGAIASNPMGISCGADCEEVYDHGTQVTLTATPDAVSAFTAWSDPSCTGLGACVVTMTGARTVGATFALNRYPLTVAKAGNATALGTVTSTPTGISCGADCDELYDANTVVTLSATTAPGASFMGWSGAGCAGTGNCVVTVVGAQSVTATFMLNQYTLSVARTGGGASLGTVTSSPAGISCGTDCSEPYQFGQSVTLTATAASGATFAGWSGGGCAGTGSCVVTLAGDTAVTASFTLDNYTLAVVRAGNAAGSGGVTSAPAGITCTTATNDCDEPYAFGTQVTLTATAGAGSTFAGWTGGGCSGSGTCVVTVDAAKTVTATFTLNEALTVTKTGTGALYGTVTSAPAGIACGNDCSENFGVGAMVTLTATVTAGAATFTGWSGACSGTSPTCVVTVAGATNAIAAFALVPYTLTAARAGDGGGTIESNPLGISCGADCAEAFDYGTMVALTATPDAGATFTGWSGGGCTGTGACNVTVTAAATVTATFQNDRPLTVTLAGNGAGAVTSAPTGINCPSDCAQPYTHGAPVVLTATPSTGSTFGGWSGGGCSGTGSCTVTMTAARSVQATFTLTTHLLTVTRAGSGAAQGTVTSTPAGISCGADCTESVNYGSQLTLMASAAAGATFIGWSGGGCSGAGACVVTVTAATTVTATFEADQALTVSRAGTGASYGRVLSSPAGVDCGADCAQGYPFDTFVDLTASVPIAAAATFTGWSGGGCSGAATTCTVRMNQAQAVTATFAIRSHTVSVAVNGGTGSGTVTSLPTGINAPTTPAAAYAYGTTVTLTASATAGSNFTGWSLAGCPGVGSCDVFVDGAKSVTATFTLQQLTLAVTKTGTSTNLGTVTSTPAGISCGATCSAGFSFNQSVQLAATTMPGVVFLGWSGEGCAGTGSCSVTMSQARNVSAAFEGDKTLTVALNGTGTGTVVSTPAGVSAPGDTTEAYPHGTMVTLTATATAATSNFAGWAGACTGAMTSCTVTMDQARSVTATFNLKTYTLTLNKAGAGVGTVTSDVTGISCGTACATQSATYNHGQVVVLSQLAGADSQFVAWGGSCSGATCSLTMTADRTVSADFKRTDKTLTVTVAGTGAGTVTSMPAGINAPTDTSEPYAHGTMVTLTATASATTSDFAGWSGGSCSGTLTTCTVTMDTARTVTATFTLKTWVLTVAKTGFGTGTVTSTAPAGAISCGGDCTETVNHGAMVTLTATPTAGDVFFGWSGGGCSGAGACTTTVTAATTVTATFDQCNRAQAEVCAEATETYTQCSATGQRLQQLSCSMGCAVGVEKCLEIKPSNDTATNELSTLLDMAATAPAIVCPAATTCTLNTSTGAMAGFQGTLPPQSSVAGVGRVVRGASMNILGTLKITGTAAPVFLIYGTVSIGGTIDVSADFLTRGPGAQTSGACVGGAGSSGGSGGTVSSGGGGAGNWGSGANGGSSTGIPAGPAGAAYGDLDLVPLLGGCTGGYTSQSSDQVGFADSSSGGAGGGVIQIVSRSSISMTSSGVINATGGGGQSGTTPLGSFIGGGGGGSGGGVLLEAPTVSLAASSIVSTKGGGGASAGNGAAGHHGKDGDFNGPGGAAAPGGTSTGAAGGAGGLETCPGAGAGCPVSGTFGGSADAGGGGGSIGIARFNTRVPLVQDGMAVVRTKFSTGTIATRQFP
ncbi:MAG: hypothetical protein IPH44_07695 [Myxococcales bacterium]|nr:hypothetical protein [Myxococcales bacterium]